MRGPRNAAAPWADVGKTLRCDLVRADVRPPARARRTVQVATRAAHTDARVDRPRVWAQVHVARRRIREPAQRERDQIAGQPAAAAIAPRDRAARLFATTPDVPRKRRSIELNARVARAVCATVLCTTRAPRARASSIPVSY
jgi:hypothetical protein